MDSYNVNKQTETTRENDTLTDAKIPHVELQMNSGGIIPHDESCRL